MLKIIISLGLLLIPFSAPAQTLERTMKIAPLTDGADRYFYVPFEVPANTKSLSVSYDYDKKGGTNVLDLGVFDSCLSAAKSDVCGFRGWSGGRRRTIFVAENTATNGYIPGKLPVGTWRVILGLYKIAPEGVEVTVKVRLNEIDKTAQTELDDEQNKTFNFPVSARIAPPQADGLTWFRGDLHIHTFHSDGTWTVKGILDYATANNLDFVGITDHNTFSHHTEIDSLAPKYPNLLAVRGEEVTTYGGHFNVWGLPTGKWIDFRVTPKNIVQLTSVLPTAVSKDSSESADIAGGKADPKIPYSINHPTAICGGCDWSYGNETWQTFSSVEIWNGAWDFQDEAALKKWDELLQIGQRIRGIGSSDSHSPPAETNAYATNLAIGTPTNFVGAKRLTQPEILAAIENGRVWISKNPTNYILSFTAAIGKSRAAIGETLSISRGEEIRFEFSGTGFPAGSTVSIISRGATQQKITLDKPNFAQSFAAKPSGNEYFRLEVRDAKGAMLALTNPIYVQLK